MYCQQELLDHEKKERTDISFFTCKFCQYITSRKSDYIKHCYTKKHILQSQKKIPVSTTPTPIHPNTGSSSSQSTSHIKYENKTSYLPPANTYTYSKQTPVHTIEVDGSLVSEYTCSICYRKYKDRSGLWKHSKKPCIRQEDSYIQAAVIQNEPSAQPVQSAQSTPHTPSPIHVINSHNQNHSTAMNPIPTSNAELCIPTDSTPTVPVVSNIYASHSQSISPQMLYDYQRFPSNDLLLEFIRQNQELKNILLEEREESRIRFNEQNAKIEELSKQNIVINHNNNNNHFNLNIFLNEKCKDAISIMDFVNSLDVNTCDVEYTGKYGYVEGITKIFIEGLKQLDVYKRPIHCTDLKRETLYIKEEDKWEKDTNEKSRLKKAIGTVVRKNVQKVKMWQDENPRCNILDSKEYMLHMSIMRQSLGGGNQEKTDRNNDKIIRNIAKEVLIDKAILRGNHLTSIQSDQNTLE
jgi:hypothetical protein